MRSSSQPETPAQGASETDWVSKFFEIRTNTLCNPSDGSTRKAWCQSVSRVKSYQKLASSNFNFTGDEEDGVTALDNSGKDLNIKCDTSIWGNYVPGPLPDLSDGPGLNGRTIGIAVGVVVGIIALGVIALLIWRKKRRSGYRSYYVH